MRTHFHAATRHGVHTLRAAGDAECRELHGAGWRELGPMRWRHETYGTLVHTDLWRWVPPTVAHGAADIASSDLCTAARAAERAMVEAGYGPFAAG